MLIMRHKVGTVSITYKNADTICGTIDNGENLN